MSIRNGSTRLDRAALKAKRAEIMAQITWIDVPSWGGSVGVRVMTGKERDAYEADIVGNRVGKDRRLNLLNIRAKLVARCLVGDDGAPLFDWRRPDDLDELGDMDAAGLDIVFKACQRANGLTDPDIEALAGNSNAEANVNSGSN